jgi:hypothetical protein
VGCLKIKSSHACCAQYPPLLGVNLLYMAHYAENDSEGRHAYIQMESSFREGGHDGSNVHIASLAEKQRIWWRTAIINACFIASWYVDVTVRLLVQSHVSTA